MGRGLFRNNNDEKVELKDAESESKTRSRKKNMNKEKGRNLNDTTVDGAKNKVAVQLTVIKTKGIL